MVDYVRRRLLCDHLTRREDPDELCVFCHQTLAVYESSAAFSPLEKLVIESAARMTGTPMEVGDELFAVLQQNFNEVQPVELTAAIAWEYYRARFDHALGIEAAGFSKGVVCVLPERPQPTAAERN